MYADKMTNSMQRTIDETSRRRAIQIQHNEDHGMVPTPLNKSKERILESTKVADGDPAKRHLKYDYSDQQPLAADPVVQYMSLEQLEKSILYTRKQMEKAAKELDFVEAARLRDELFALEAFKKDKK